jgi:hypothetical protein
MARLTPDAPPARPIRWRRAIRIISSRYPPIGPYDSVAEPQDLDAVFYTESLTNPRLSREWGDLSQVAPDQRISGPGTTPIMAAFTHPTVEGSRFSDGSYGVYYAAHDEQTAVAETVYHRERIMRFSQERPMRLEMRQYAGGLKAELVDLRGQKDAYPAVYDPEDYTASQAFGAKQRTTGRAGIVYDSVRRAGGQCAAIFKPQALQPVRQSKHYYYVWNGKRITDVLEVSQARSWRNEP